MMEMEFFFLDWKASMTLQVTNRYYTRNIYNGDIAYNRNQTIVLTIDRCKIIMLNLLKPDT